MTTRDNNYGPQLSSAGQFVVPTVQTVTSAA